MHRAAALAASVLALCALGGCGVGAGPASDEPVRLTITRDFGAKPIGERAIDDVPQSETVMRLLQRSTDVKTRYGGGFVSCIDDLCGDTSQSADWLYYLNGSELTKGAAAVRVSGGDRVWWDRHDWTATQRIPAVVGSFPEPFLHGPGSSKRLPVRVECADLESAPCRAVAAALVRFGVPAAKGTLRRSITSETLRVVVGPWVALRDDNALVMLEDGPAASGVFAEPRPSGDAIALLDTRGRAQRTVGAGAGLIAATAAGDDPPVWAVTGTDEAGVAAAARAFTERSLHSRFAVAIENGSVLGLPLAGESEQ
jgi:hypothetical protein